MVIIYQDVLDILNTIRVYSSKDLLFSSLSVDMERFDRFHCFHLYLNHLLNPSCHNNVAYDYERYSMLMFHELQLKKERLKSFEKLQVITY